MKTYILKITRYIFWLYFTEFFLHFIYVNAIRYHPRVILHNRQLIVHSFMTYILFFLKTVETLSPWALYGLGYCMGQYFLIKYVVVYGINGTICEIDGIRSPPQPKCIARIHLYSDMWKYFDRGMYKFLVRCLYDSHPSISHKYINIRFSGTSTCQPKNLIQINYGLLFCVSHLYSCGMECKCMYSFGHSSTS